jgi:hypothetical protein
MRILGRIAVPVWLVVLGAIVMYVFFVIVASVPPAQVAAVTVVVAVLALLFLIRSVRLSSELSHRGGNPAIRRSLNRQRERRGF